MEYRIHTLRLANACPTGELKSDSEAFPQAHKPPPLYILWVLSGIPQGLPIKIASRKESRERGVLDDDGAVIPLRSTRPSPGA